MGKDLLTVELAADEGPSEFRNRVAIIHGQIRIVRISHIGVRHHPVRPSFQPLQFPHLMDGLLC